MQPGVLALDTTRGPVLWIQPEVQYSGYSKGFSTLLWIQPGVLALDPTMDSGFINLGSISSYRNRKLDMDPIMDSDLFGT